MPLGERFDRLVVRQRPPAPAASIHSHGHVRPRGKRNPVWEAFWREDVIENGVVHRVQRKEILGTIKDYPTLLIF
jgi:hypothetical protein